VTHWVTKDIGSFRSELNQINEDVRRFDGSVDNDVDAWDTYERFMPEYGNYIAQTNRNLESHPTTEMVHEMIAASIRLHVYSLRYCVKPMKKTSKVDY
jgi:hypothetical protein